MRRATLGKRGCDVACVISIHALREESDAPDNKVAIRIIISIHALREESDARPKGVNWFISQFQSTLSVRRATLCPVPVPVPDKFQSTLSVRRATISSAADAAHGIFQSTLSVRRATIDWHDIARILQISIHALREESDAVRGCEPFAAVISIHALREESDHTGGNRRCASADFNPRSP